MTDSRSSSASNKLSSCLLTQKSHVQNKTLSVLPYAQLPAIAGSLCRETRQKTQAAPIIISNNHSLGGNHALALHTGSSRSSRTRNMVLIFFV